MEIITDTWISVEDELPPINHTFDAFTNQNERKANHGAYVGGWDDEFRLSVMQINGITHWMIPTSPDGEIINGYTE